VIENKVSDIEYRGRLNSSLRRSIFEGYCSRFFSSVFTFISLEAERAASVKYKKFWEVREESLTYITQIGSDNKEKKVILGFFICYFVFPERL